LRNAPYSAAKNEIVSNSPTHPPPGEVNTAVQVHLGEQFQQRNVRLYVLKWCVVFLAAPVMYIGFVQVGLCKRLGASDFVANLPSSVYLAMAAFPVIMVWAVPQVRFLKLVMMIGFITSAVMGALTAVVLWLPVPDWLRIVIVIVHAAVVACSSGTAWAFEWELIGRGVSESRRGRMFAIAFSIGPLFAVAGSLAAQLIINNEVFGWTPPFWPEIPYPLNYTVMYGMTLPLLLLAGLLVSGYVIPLPKTELQRQPFIQGVFGGFGQLVCNRFIVMACVAYLLVYSGTLIQNNMVLFTREAVELPEDTFVGYQLAIRFGCKVFAGLILGWLLKLTNPCMNLYATALLVALGVMGIIIAPLFSAGLFFLIAFGFNGAGELMGLYYPYYVLCLSPKSQMRRNMAFVMLISAPVGLAPALYGAISDRWGLTTSFWLALALVIAGLVLVAATLPARPRPRPEDLESD